MSAVQFNLLPDVKLDFVKTQRIRRMVVSTSLVVGSVTLGIFLILLIFVFVVQKQQLNSAGKAVEASSKQLKNIPNVATAVTVNDQLKSLTGLHQNKHMVGRIFTYLAQLTPSNLSIGKLDMDMATNAMSISGNADSQQTVNSFIDTLKATTYKIGTASAKPAFSSVLESDFSINAGNVSYKLNLQFDPTLFANNVLDAQGQPQVPQLTVPSQQTTQSDIFKAQTGGGQ